MIKIPIRKNAIRLFKSSFLTSRKPLYPKSKLLKKGLPSTPTWKPPSESYKKLKEEDKASSEPSKLSTSKKSNSKKSQKKSKATKSSITMNKPKKNSKSHSSKKQSKVSWHEDLSKNSDNRN
jgi:hypothetical protein